MTYYFTHLQPSAVNQNDIYEHSSLSKTHSDMLQPFSSQLSVSALVHTQLNEGADVTEEWQLIEVDGPMDMDLIPVNYQRQECCCLNSNMP